MHLSQMHIEIRFCVTYQIDFGPRSNITLKRNNQPFSSDLFLLLSCLVCRKATVADIVFLVDSSSSVGPENFQKVKNFIDTLVSSLNVGTDHVRIGLAQYSDDPYVEFLLNQYSLKNDILEQIQNLTFRGGNTYTGAALNFTGERYFVEAAGSRAQEHVSQVIILITDGESNDDVKVPATKLKARGISVYVVGIGIQDVNELKEIASKPFEKFLFSIDSFDILQKLPSSLLQTVCFAVESQIKGKQIWSVNWPHAITFAGSVLLL